MDGLDTFTCQCPDTHTGIYCEIGTYKIASLTHVFVLCPPDGSDSGRRETPREEKERARERERREREGKRKRERERDRKRKEERDCGE